MNLIPARKLQNLINQTDSTSDAYPMKIMMFDLHILFRTGLVSLLRDQPQIQILLTASFGPDVLKQVTDFEPDILIMGGDLYEDGGREVMGDVLAVRPEIAILILAFRESTELMLDVIRNGAKGYLPMDFSKAVLIKSLYAMARGEVAISRSMTAKLAKEFSRLSRVGHGDAIQIEPLILQEQDVLDLLATDATNNEIALKLFISSHSVRILVSKDGRKYQKIYKG